MRSSPATAPPKLCPGRFSLSRPISVRPQSVPPNGWLGAIIALGGIFLPSFLLIWGSLPFWDVLRASKTFRRALIGTNAAVVGILLAALYTPVATTAITSPLDLAIAAAAFALLTLGRAPPIAVVVVTALATQLLSAG